MNGLQPAPTAAATNAEIAANVEGLRLQLSQFAVEWDARLRALLHELEKRP